MKKYRFFFYLPVYSPCGTKRYDSKGSEACHWKTAPQQQACKWSILTSPSRKTPGGRWQKWDSPGAAGAQGSRICEKTKQSPSPFHPYSSSVFKCFHGHDQAWSLMFMVNRAVVCIYIYCFLFHTTIPSGLLQV